MGTQLHESPRNGQRIRCQRWCRVRGQRSLWPGPHTGAVEAARQLAMVDNDVSIFAHSPGPDPECQTLKQICRLLDQSELLASQDGHLQTKEFLLDIYGRIPEVQHHYREADAGKSVGTFMNIHDDATKNMRYLAQYLATTPHDFEQFVGSGRNGGSFMIFKIAQLDYLAKLTQGQRGAFQAPWESLPQLRPPDALPAHEPSAPC